MGDEQIRDVMRYSRRGLGSWLRSQPCGQLACCTTGCAALCARNCSLAPGAGSNIRLRVEKSAPDRCRLCTVAIYFRRSVSDFFVCASYGKRGKKGRIVHFLRLPPQKDEIGRGPGEGSKHRTLSRCYQLRMLKNIDGSIVASDVGKRDFVGLDTSFVVVHRAEYFEGRR